MTINYTTALMTLATINLDKLVNFYTNLLQQQPITNIPNVYAEFNLAGMRLGIFKPKQTHELEFQNAAKSKVSLCLEVNNLEVAIAHITNLGYPPPGEIAIASHGREIYAYDPDGNRLILHQAITGNN
ncbi:VOC family protein [Anabaena azotica]|uniref:VOC family protein n=1 Tax=Anabaena azotica FACHB-119 TaxID=947527 RepID=A0ABR8D4L7_9NOST|nr:VOC family protein [Anabaena azotica]MBD2501401.1 VOC family protein [Anabaena azotica FACHB-119]